MLLLAWRHRLLLALALAYAAANVVYSGVWIYATRRGASAFLGIDSEYDLRTASMRLISVASGTGAERAGLTAGDRIVAVNGRGLGTRAPFEAAVQRGHPGDRVTLSIVRDRVPTPITLVAVVGEHPDRTARKTLTRWIAGEILGAYPVLFLTVAIPVLLMRVTDRDAWLLALLFAGFIAGAPFNDAVVPDALRGPTTAFELLFWIAAPALCLCFFAVFPERSPLDRRLPWLKAAWLAAALAVAVPSAASALWSGSPFPLEVFRRALPGAATTAAAVLYSAGGFALGLLSLTLTAVRGSETARRKTRVIVWGVVFGVAPFFTLQLVSGVLGRNPYEISFWLWAPSVMALFLVPLSIAYAVLKHRVLDMPVLLRRGARYILVQRGAVGLLALLGLGTTLAFADSVAGYLDTPSSLPAAALGGVAFGGVLILTGSRVHRRLRGRIDRAFFRSAYDARKVLQDLAQEARQATSREKLAAEIDDKVVAALLPRSLSVYLETGRGTLVRSTGTGGDREALAAAHPALEQLARRGRPLQLDERTDQEMLPRPLAASRPECLVPMADRDGRLIGLISLGRRLSEEPYAREDLALLASVANQAAIALENLRLAEQVAERLDAERRATLELQLAQEVQSRLLPQEHPPLRTLEYAGQCTQARAVGGDYYDFLDLGPGRVALVLADVSGKGFAAALLMAALQASLRSRHPEDMGDLPRQLRAVNHLLFRSSEISRYATLFIGVYDDRTRTLVYANCGHNPPLVLRTSGAIERLEPTGPVLGLLEDWECAASECSIGPGDLVILFTDGVVEAFSDAGEEFGEARVLAALRDHRGGALPAIMKDLVDEVREFSGSEQEDDLTLVLARGV